MVASPVAELYGLEVRTSDGNVLGKVEEIYLDDVSGRPEIARVKHGFLGRKLTLVPIVAATRQGAALVGPYAEDTIEQAPKVEIADHIAAEQEAQMLRYYGISVAPAVEPAAAQAPERPRIDPEQYTGGS